jgi:hypothetical protein
MRLLLLLLVSWVVLNADGLKFNESRTHLAESYTTLHLTDSQKRQIERSRVVTLTNPQWKSLRQIGNVCPKQLQVLTSRFEDCTCGMAAIAVWFVPGELEVPHSHLPRSKTMDWSDPSIPFYGLVIDPDGSLWLKGKSLPRSKEATAMVSIANRYRKEWANEAKPGAPGLCVIETPPVCAVRKIAAIQESIHRLESKATTLNVLLSAPGFVDNPKTAE